MPGAPSPAELLALLRRYDLVPAAEVDSLAGGDEAALARQLVESGKLTPFQVRQLREGNGADLVVGPYLLLERLGAGGMGEVYKARHRLLNRIDALKLVRADLIGVESAVARFRQEITAAAKLRHPNIVLTYSADQTARGLWLAMEFCDGPDLGRVVMGGGPLAVTRACDYAVQAANGLQHLASHGLVHRDIKPTNLLLTNGTIIILDFGLARLRPAEDPTRLTLNGVVLGSPDFLAPEQARNAGAADCRSDIYGLGCTLYFLLTTQVPFPGGTSWEKVLKHVSATPIPIERLRPEIPPALGAVVRKMMARDPNNRYQTPAEVIEALTQFRDSTLDAARPDAAPGSTEFAPPFVSALPRTPPLSLSSQTPIVPEGDALTTDLVNESVETRRSGTRIESPPARSQWQWVAIGGLALAGAIVLTVALWPSGELEPVPDPNKIGKVEGPREGPTPAPAVVPAPAPAFEELTATGDNSLDALPIVRIAFAPPKGNPHLLAVARGKPNGPGGLELWNLRDGKRTVLLGGPKQPPISAVAWSLPDGKFLACGAGHPEADVPDATVTLFDTSTRMVLQQFPTASQGALALGFPPYDSNQLVVGTRIRNAGGVPSGGIELWSGTNGWTRAARRAQVPDPVRVPPVPAPDGPVTAVAFNPKKSSVFAIVGWEGKVRIWVILPEKPGTLRAGAVYPEPKGPAVALGPITDASYSADGRWLACVPGPVGRPNPPAHARQVLLWDFWPNEQNPTPRTVPPENASDVCSLAFLPEEKGVVKGFVTGEQNGRVRVWDLLPEFQERAVHLKPLDGPVSDLSFAPDGQALVVGGTRLVRIPIAALSKK